MQKTIIVVCQTCGIEFHIAPSRVHHGRGRSCSRACQYAAAYRRRCRVSLVCVGCGTTFQRMPSLAAKSRFCSRVCRDTHRVRELHPQYKGQPTQHRGPNWQAQKRAVRARDKGQCQHCGAPGPDVHHKLPYRLFSDYREANALDNLITLCKPCHRKADAEAQTIA